MLFFVSAAFAFPFHAPTPPADLERPTCRTPALLIARAEDDAAGVPRSPDPYRPTSVGYVDSTTYPLRIHYRRADDQSRAAGTIMDIMETCWRIEVDEMGWPQPPEDSGLGGDDKYDVYLTNEETYGGAYTWGTGNDTDRSDGWYSLSSYIAVDDRSINDADMPDFLCHEFNHALQYTIDGNEQTLFPWESTAEAMEELTYPKTDLYQLDVPDFQELPFMSILFDGYSSEVEAYNDYSYYEYGGSIFGLFLEQRYGSYDGTKLLELWEGLAAGSRDSEPDFVDSLETIGGAEAADHGAVYLEFATWRMFAGPLDDGAHYYEGGEWGARGVVAQEERLNLATLDGVTLTPVDKPYDLGTTYWRIDIDDPSDRGLRIEVSGDADPEWGIVAGSWLEGAPARTVTARGGSNGAPVSVDLDLRDARLAMFGVASLGPKDLNAEGRHPVRSFTVTLSLVDPPEGDSGDSGDNGGDNGADSGDDGKVGGSVTGCGCASGGTSAPGLAVGALLGLAALARRRR